VGHTHRPPVNRERANNQRKFTASAGAAPAPTTRRALTRPRPAAATTVSDRSSTFTREKEAKQVLDQACGTMTATALGYQSTPHKQIAPIKNAAAARAIQGPAKRRARRPSPHGQPIKLKGSFCPAVERYPLQKHSELRKNSNEHRDQTIQSLKQGANYAPRKFATFGPLQFQPT